MKLKHLCVCGRVVKGRCESCSSAKRTSNDGYRPNSHERYGSAWNKVAANYRAKHPLCQPCMADGRTTAAKDVHHIVKVSDRPELVYDEDNLLSVCRACHKRLDSV